MSHTKQVVTVAILMIAISAILYAANTIPAANNRKAPSNILNSKNNTSSDNPTNSITYITTPYIREFSLPHDTWPDAILVDKSRIVWTVGSNSHTLIKFDPRQGKIISSYPITESLSEDNESKGFPLMAWTMVQDNDGHIWFSRLGEDKIWRFDPVTERFAVFHSSASAFQMKVDAETGNIWFTTLSGNTVGVIQKINTGNSQYKIKEFNLGNDTQPTGLSVKKDHLWVTELSTGKLVEFAVVRDKDGMITNIAKISEISSLHEPTDVLVSGNNTLWITEHGTSTMTRYSMGSQGLTRFQTSSNEYQTVTLPLWLRASRGDDGFWFNEHGGNRVGFFDTKDMKLTEYEIPSRPADGYVVYPLDISIDPADNNKLWFSEWNTDKIGVLDRSIPLPFDIYSGVHRVMLVNGSLQRAVDIQVGRANNEPPSNNNETLVLKSSDPVSPSGQPANMTLHFTPGMVDLRTAKSTPVQLIVGNYSRQEPGNYSVTISAYDGTVTKSIFIDLELGKITN